MKIQSKMSHGLFVFSLIVLVLLGITLLITTIISCILVNQLDQKNLSFDATLSNQSADTEIEYNVKLSATVERISDGDTLSVTFRRNGKTKTLRLANIDTPEYRQAYGNLATKAMKAYVSNGMQVTVIVTSVDKYDRLVAYIYKGNLCLNAEMVKEGHAWVHPFYCEDKSYFQYQAQARLAKRGLWSSDREAALEPWYFRDGLSKERLNYAQTAPLKFNFKGVSLKNRGKDDTPTRWLYVLIPTKEHCAIEVIPFKVATSQWQETVSAGETQVSLTKEHHVFSAVGEGIIDWKHKTISCYTDDWFSYYSDGQDVITAIIAKRIQEYFAKEYSESLELTIKDWPLTYAIGRYAKLTE